MSASFPPPPEARAAQSKPIWKRWWFWVAVAVVILIVAGVAGADSGPTTAEASSPSQAASTTPSIEPTTTAAPAPETARVPNVDGTSIDAARSKVKAVGFAVSVETKLTNSVPAGTVLHQSERAGSRTELGWTITLTVAKPLPTIPNVVGKTLANAKKSLEKAGFDVGKITQQTSSQTKGTVISQSPAGGTSTRPGRIINLVTAKAAPTTTSTGTTDNCTPGYSPCLVYHGGADYDCAGGSGDGPYYAYQTERVTGSDPYGLDADGDGYGCE